MAKRIKSGLKRKRQAVRRTVRNLGVRSEIRTLVKQARQASGPSGDALRAAVSALDAAARRGIIHPNAAARRKSRLMRRPAAPAVAGASRPA